MDSIDSKRKRRFVRLERYKQTDCKESANPLQSRGLLPMNPVQRENWRMRELARGNVDIKTNRQTIYRRLNNLGVGGELMFLFSVNGAYGTENLLGIG
ncbi:Hypothetical protein NTJ_01185 [Nesidiocoris tenuis]|nr:Hypothetical protein NTJ_01185 [Nesidiocoris tenuis]